MNLAIDIVKFIVNFAGLAGTSTQKTRNFVTNPSIRVKSNRKKTQPL
jgi:hypothetical protein